MSDEEKTKDQEDEDITLTCTRCDDDFDEDNGVWHEDAFYCSECFSERFDECYNCGDIRRRNYMYFFADENYCEDCFSEISSDCEECGERFLNDDLMRDGDDRTLCRDCYESFSHHRFIHDYSYRPSPNVRKIKNRTRETLLMGIEIEVNNSDRDRESIDNDVEKMLDVTGEFIYAKEDSSIERGYEVVTHPFTWDYYKQRIASDKGILDVVFDLKGVGYKSYDTSCCGIHVHINKASFGTFHFYKFMKFFFENEQFIFWFSRRRQGQYNEWCSSDSGVKENLPYYAKNKKGGRRHSAINISNDITYEIRIFRGTLKKESCLANIEFVKALYDFTKDCKPSELTKKYFLRFVRQNKKEYVNLYKLLFSRITQNTEILETGEEF